MNTNNNKIIKCKTCGETDIRNFYDSNKSCCRSCHKNRTIKYMYDNGILGKRTDNSNNFNSNNNSHNSNDQYSFRICKKCNCLKSELDFSNKKECKTCSNNPIRSLFNAAKSRAKIRELDFNLELDDLIMPEKCPVLGIKIEKNANHVGPNSPSLDRINNNKGYVKGNIRIISHRANWIKSNASLDELVLIYEDCLRNNANTSNELLNKQIENK